MRESQFQQEVLPPQAYVLDLRQHMSTFNAIRQMPDDDAKTAALLTLQAEHNPWVAVHAIGAGYAAMRLMAIHLDRFPNLKQLYPNGVARVRNGGLNHDGGKIGIDNVVWDYPGEHPDNMKEARRYHTLLAWVVANLAGLNDPIHRNMMFIHHEKANGQGHPDGLVEGQIPLEAEIGLVADAWHAISNFRPYFSTRRTPEQAYNHTLVSVFDRNEAPARLRKTFTEFFKSGAWKMPTWLSNPDDIYAMPPIGQVMDFFQQATRVVEQSPYIDLHKAFPFAA